MGYHSSKSMIDALRSKKKNRKARTDKLYTFSSKAYNKFKDHTEMTTHEYAAFQKKLFKERRKYRKKVLIIFITSIIITFLIILFFPLIASLF